MAHLYFPVPFHYRNNISNEIDATHVITAHSVSHTECNALKCSENAFENWECLDFQIFKFSGGDPDPFTGSHARGGFAHVVPFSGGLDTHPCQILDLPWSDKPFERYIHSEFSKKTCSHLLDLVQPEVKPFDLLAMKTVPKNQIWRGSNDPLRKYSHSKFSNMAAGCHLGFDRTGNNTTRSADPKKPTLEQNWLNQK